MVNKKRGELKKSSKNARIGIFMISLAIIFSLFMIYPTLAKISGFATVQITTTISNQSCGMVLNNSNISHTTPIAINYTDNIRVTAQPPCTIQNTTVNITTKDLQGWSDNCTGWLSVGNPDFKVLTNNYNDNQINLTVPVTSATTYKCQVVYNFSDGIDLNNNQSVVNVTVIFTNADPSILSTTIYDISWVSQNYQTVNPSGTANNVTLYVNTTVYDANGWDDVSTVTCRFTEQANTSNYKEVSGTNSCSGPGTTCLWMCTFGFEYYQEPGNWTLNVTAVDTFGKNGSDITKWFTYNTTVSVDYTNIPVQFGTVVQRTTVNASFSAGYPVNATQYGNININMSVSGSHMTGQGDNNWNIGVGNMTWNTTSNWPMSADGTALSTTAAVWAGNVTPLDNGNTMIKQLYYRLSVPAPLKSQLYNGTTTLEVIQAE